MSRRLSEAWPELLTILAYLILPLMLYVGVTIGSRTMLPADNLYQWPPWQAAAIEKGVSTPHNALISDLVIQNYAWKRFVMGSLAGGEIPLWNPYLFAGAPFLANGQHAALYPFGLVFLVVPLAKAYGWFALSQIWLAGVSMYVFGRILGMGRGGAALAGLVYQGAQFLVISAAVFPMVAAAVIWLPFLLGCIERIVTLVGGRADSRHRTVLWAAAGAVALGCQILAGHAEFTYYTLLIMALYAAWRMAVEVRNRRDERRAVRESVAQLLARGSLWLAGMVCAGLLLGALQLVPLFEAGSTNFREGSASFEEVRAFAFPPRNALTLLLPNFFGNPSHHTYRDAFSGRIVPFDVNYHGAPNPNGARTSSWGVKNFVEGAMYLGILSLALAGMGALAVSRTFGASIVRRGQAAFFAGLAFLSLAFIFGTPLYALLYYGLPFINQLHTPFRWVFPLSLAVAVLAGFGAEGVESARRAGDSTGNSRDTGRFRWLQLSQVAAGVLLAGGAAVLLGVSLARLFFATARPALERVFLGLAGAADAFPSVEAFFSYNFWQVLLLGGMLVASGLVLLLAVRGGSWIPFACGLVIIDLFLASAGFHAAVDPDLLGHTPDAVRWLTDQPGDWRITTYDTVGAGTLNANTPWLFNLADVRGYDSIIPRQFTEFMALIEPQNGLQFNRVQPAGSVAALESPLLDALAVKYVIASEPIDSADFRPVWDGEGVTIYENLSAAPRAYTLPVSSEVRAGDVREALSQYSPLHHVILEAGELSGSAPLPAELVAARIAGQSNNEIIVEASPSEQAWLIVGDSFAPGWRAYVRPAGSNEDAEQEAEITRVNGNFRGVRLAAGDWIVRMRYSPRSFQLGGLMSFMGVTVLVFALGTWVWRRLYRPEAMATTTRSVAKNSAAPMTLNLFNKGIDFVFAAFYLRVLGPADAGSFATAIAAAGIFEIVANYGLNILLIRDVSQDKAQAGRFLLNSSVLRLFTALIAAIPIVIYVVISARGTNPLSPAEVTAIFLMMIGMVFSGLALGVSGLFYVYEEAEIPAAMATVTTIVKVALGVAVLLAGFSFVGLAAVSIASNVITLVMLTILAARRFALHGPWSIDGPLLRGMVRLGFPLMLIHLLQTIFISIDVLLLRQLLPNGEQVVGWYNSAWKWFNALQIIPSFFTLALFPIISRAIKENIDSARRMMRMSLKLMLMLALPTAALITFAAPIMIGVLGGREFLPQGAIALQIIIWSIPFGWLNSVTNYVLIALGLETMQPRAFAVAVGFNVVANLIFIPRYSFIAAGVITILSEVVLLLMFAYYLRQRDARIGWMHLAGRLVLLTAIMLTAMWLGNRIHLLVALVTGVIVYLVGLLALRVIEEDERSAIVAVLPGSVTRRLSWLLG